MTAFSTASDALFRDRNLASDAVYRAGGVGDGVTVRVIRRSPDRIASFGEGRYVTASRLLDVRIAEAPQLARGDTFEIAGAVFEVMSDPVRDSQQLTWSAEIRDL